MAEATQQDVDNLSASIQGVASDLAQAQSDAVKVNTEVQAEIARLQAANPGVDLTALQAAVAPLDGVAKALDASVNAIGTIAPLPSAGSAADPAAGGTTDASSGSGTASAPDAPA